MNKSKRLKEKKYFDRFNKLNVYSYIRDNLPWSQTVYGLFSDACGRVADKGICSVDQSALQYYMIFGLQDFYQNHFLLLWDENIVLKEELDKTQTMLMNLKKNDERFEFIMNHTGRFSRSNDKG